MYELFINRDLIQKRMQEQFRPGDRRASERPPRFRVPAGGSGGQARPKRRVRRLAHDLWGLLGQA